MSSVREYNIDYNKPDEAARITLQIHIDTLVSIRGNANDEAELEWEIRLYEFMMKDPAPRLKLYQDTRYKNFPKLPKLSKREVVKILGWDVP